MRRPKVNSEVPTSTEKINELYDYYVQHEQSVRFAKFGYALINKIFKPHVSFETGAEKEIRRLLEEDELSLVLAANHVTNNDHYQLSGAASESPALNPLVGHTDILAKASLFKIVGIRQIIDGFGGIPTFREKEGGNARTAAAVVEASVKRIEQGRHMAIFPERTNHTQDPTLLMDFKPGIGHIVTRARKRNRETAILPIGISYYGDSAKKAEVVVGMPITDQFVKPGEVVEATREGMQKALDQASVTTGRRES
ncbi:MAG: 1-acyl-sn-glycerol-3-phosphate acyltransferase [Candidatus Saccharimonadales bacterium]